MSFRSVASGAAVFVTVLCATEILSGYFNETYARTPQECSNIYDNLQRLTCFDDIFPGALNENPNETMTGWEVKEEKSPIDNSPRFFALLLPSGVKKTLSGLAGPSIMLACSESKTKVVYYFGKPSGHKQSRVTYNLGDEPSKSDIWATSDDGEAVWLSDNEHAIPFLKHLKVGSTLKIRTDTPFSEAVFELGRVDDVVNKIAAACNWK